MFLWVSVYARSGWTAQFRGDVLHEGRDDGDELRLAQPSECLGTFEIAARAVLQHGGLSRLEGQLGDIKTKAQRIEKRRAVALRMSSGCTPQPLDQIIDASIDSIGPDWKVRRDGPTPHILAHQRCDASREGSAMKENVSSNRSGQ